ncbi:cysteine desulfurase, partial [Candidatus Peregrinibacteria bacterium CG_4_9_14_0_2_um_filter_41_14]
MKINAVKNRFPIFTTYPDLVYLDSAATAQKPDLVIQSVVDFYTKYNANTHRAIYELGEQATLIYETAREKVAVFINAGESREIVFTKNATEALNLIAKTWGKANLKKGDTVVITLMEHHSNFIPWLMLKEELGINVEVVGLTSEGDVDLDQ